MQGKDFYNLLRDESFLNYCFGSNPDDMRHWEKWLEEHTEDRAHVLEIKNLAILLSNEVMIQEENDQFIKLKKRIRKNEKSKLFHLNPIFFKIAVAALVLVAVVLGFYFYQNLFSHHNNATVKDIDPAGFRATLSFENGQKIVLDSTQKGIIVANNNIKYTSGSKTATIGALDGAMSTFVTLTTPRGGQYQIILADGSKVWLNAASTLKYPSHFNGDSRTVELEGEAFFQVEKSVGRHAPFIVKSKGQKILVLGTSFNLTAYVDEKSTRTTLVSGAIQVSHSGTGEESIINKRIRPGQQVIHTGDEMMVKKVDVTNEIAWHDGKFSFSGKTFKQSMDEMARWYDIEVIYEGPAPTKGFFGRANRSSKLSVILKLLKSAEVPYHLEGRKLFIHPKSKES